MRFLSALILLFAATAQAEPGVCPDGRININEAPAEVLKRLKGVGDKKAEAIIAARTEKGGAFPTVAALNDVKGIGDKSMENWAAQITTDCNAPAAKANGLIVSEGVLDAAKKPAGDKAAGAAGDWLDPTLKPLNLNTATAEQLGALPGIGPKTAEAIIALRTQKGGFKSVDELGEVKGIGEAKLAKLKPLLTLPAQ